MLSPESLRGPTCNTPISTQRLLACRTAPLRTRYTNRLNPGNYRDIRDVPVLASVRRRVIRSNQWMLAGLTNCTADLVPGDQHGSSSQQPRIDDVVDVTSVYCRSEKLYRGDGAVMRAAAAAGSVEGGLVDGRRRQQYSTNRPTSVSTCSTSPTQPSYYRRR